MCSIRVTSVCFVVALAFAPLPAQAQGGPPGGGGSAANLAARVEALEAAVASLQNSLTAEAAARAAADTTLQVNINSEAAARMAADTTLQEQIGKLKGNITATDLEGIYNFYFVATALDPAPNTITSYVLSGTATLGTGGTGYMDVAASGRL